MKKTIVNFKITNKNKKSKNNIDNINHEALCINHFMPFQGQSRLFEEVVYFHDNVKPTKGILKESLETGEMKVNNIFNFSDDARYPYLSDYKWAFKQGFFKLTIISIREVSNE